jgi:transcriptional regulator GlxA family with amidase domain
MTTQTQSRNGAGRPRRQVERALALIADQLDGRVRVPVVAAYLGVSERTLRHRCTAHLGTSPARLLRQQRLIQAHSALPAADTGSATVTEVALRFGFGHLGRFAVQYREAFGERPSDTLRAEHLRKVIVTADEP